MMTTEEYELGAVRYIAAAARKARKADAGVLAVIDSIEERLSEIGVELDVEANESCYAEAWENGPAGRSRIAYCVAYAKQEGQWRFVVRKHREYADPDAPTVWIGDLPLSGAPTHIRRRALECFLDILPDIEADLGVYAQSQENQFLLPKDAKPRQAARPRKRATPTVSEAGVGVGSSRWKIVPPPSPSDPRPR